MMQRLRGSELSGAQLREVMLAFQLLVLHRRSFLENHAGSIEVSQGIVVDLPSLNVTRSPIPVLGKTMLDSC